MKWIVTNCQSVGNTHDICQDRTYFRQNGDLIVAALADGLSSNSLSDLGAKFFTEAACEEICNNFDEYYNNTLSSRDFVERLQKSIGDKYNDTQIQEMKCTLLFCAISENRYLLGHIGDGAILCFGEKSKVISRPQENEIGGTATYTILDHNASEHFMFIKGVIEGCDGFLLTSDGLLGNAYYDGQELPDFAYKLFGSIYNFDDSTSKEQRDLEYQKYLSECIQKDNAYADDCSIVIIARENKTGIIDYKAVNGFEADVMWPCKCGQRNCMDSIRCSNCRQMYLSVYSEDMIQIIEKESFFSKFNKWLSDGKNFTFSPEECAVIKNNGLFEKFCKNMKKVYRKVVDENNSTAADISLPVVTESTNEALVLVPQKPIKQQNNTSKKNSLIRFGKKVCYGVGKQISTFIDSTICAIARIGKSKMHKSDELVLKYNELLNLAYELGYLPVELTMGYENPQLSDHKKRTIEAMFTYDVCFSYMETSNNTSKDPYEESNLQFYKKNNWIYIINKLLSDDSFQIIRQSSNSDTVGNIVKIISDDINKYKVSNRHPNDTVSTFRWKWRREFVLSHNSPEKLYISFNKAIAHQTSYGDFLGTCSNIWWMVSRNSKKHIKMCAVILSSERLFLLTTKDEETVSIEELSKEEIVRHIGNFITEQLCSEKNIT